MATALLLSPVESESVAHQWTTEAAHAENQSRGETRFPYLSSATLSSEDATTQVMCRELSRNGIGIIQATGAPIEGAGTLSLTLRKQEVYLDVNFLWAKDMGNGWWISGGELNFASIDSASLLLLQISKFVQQRIHARYPYCQPFCVYADLELAPDCIGIENIQHRKEIHAVSIDVSRGGIHLVCKNPLLSNREFVYMRRMHSTSFEQLVRGRVVSRKRIGKGYYAIGVKFDFD